MGKCYNVSGMAKTRDPLRQQLINMLTVVQAHMSFADAVAKFPQDLINTKPPQVEYTFWHLIEHLRLTQTDILDYCVNSHYQERKWPDEYWPAKDAQATWADWQKTIQNFQKDLQKLVELVQDPQTDLFKHFPWGEGSHNLLREAIIVAQHNAYHIGELGILRQVMNAWPKERGV